MGMQIPPVSSEDCLTQRAAERITDPHRDFLFLRRGCAQAMLNELVRRYPYLAGVHQYPEF
jgi:hypothetical protein